MSFASVPGCWAMDIKCSTYATKYWKEGQVLYKMHNGFYSWYASRTNVLQKTTTTKIVAFKSMGLFTYKWIKINKKKIQCTAIPFAHVSWIRAKLFIPWRHILGCAEKKKGLKSFIRSGLASAKVIL